MERSGKARDGRPKPPPPAQVCYPRRGRFTMDEESIFNNALEKRDRRERSACLAEACGQDEELRRRVEALLAFHDEAGDFLEHSPIHADASDATDTFDKDPSRSSDPNEPPLSFLGPSEKANCLGIL